MKIQNVIFVALIAMFVIYSSALADESQNVELVGYAFDRWDYSSDITLYGDVAYVSTGKTGIKIVDISDVNNPTPIGAFGEAYTGAISAKIESELLFIAYSNKISGDQDRVENHMAVYSIQDATHPELQSYTQLENGVFSQFLINGNRIYFSVTDNPWDESHSQLFVMDFTDPQSPELSEFWGVDDFVQDIFITGDIAYILVREDILILNISDPDNIELMSTFPDESFGGNNRIIVEGDVAYVLDYNYVVCLDVSDLENIQIMGEVFTEGGCVVTIYDLSKVGDVLYFAEKLDWCDGSPTDGYVNAIDVGDPNNPVFLGRNEAWSSKFPTGIEPIGESILVSLGKGLKVMDYSDPEFPVEIGEFDSGGDARHVDLSGNSLYVVEHESEYGSSDEKLHIMDISNPGNANLTSTNNILANGIDIESDFACVLNDSGLIVYDISDPLEVSEVSSFQIEHGGQIKIRGDLAYMNDNGYLVTFDLSNPDQPEILSEVLLRQHRVGEYRFDLVGDYIYIGAVSGQVIVVDIAIPNRPRLAGQFDTGSEIVDIRVSGEFAYLSLRETGLLILDVSDPADMMDINLYEYAEPGIIDVSFDFLYLQSSPYLLTVLDKSDAENIQERGFYSFGEGEIIRDIMADGAAIYVAYGSNVAILDNSMLAVGENDKNVEFPDNFGILDVYPNPFNSTATIRYSLPAQSAISIAIFDSNGKQVQELQNGVLPAGVHQNVWSANSVSAGVYFMKINGDNNLSSGTHKVTLIK